MPKKRAPNSDRRDAQIAKVYAQETAGPENRPPRPSTARDRQRKQDQLQAERERRKLHREVRQETAKEKRAQREAKKQRRARQSKRSLQPEWTGHPNLIEQVVACYNARREQRGYRLQVLFPDRPIKDIVVQYHQRKRGLARVARLVKMERGTVKQILRRLNLVAGDLGLT